MNDYGSSWTHPEDEESVSAHTTMDFGLHHGLRIAEIAVLRGAVPEIIKNGLDNSQRTR